MMDPTFAERLETPRLELCAYKEQDVEALARLVDANRELLRRNFHDTAKKLTTADATRAFIQETAAQRQARTVFHYGIWTRPAPVLIGQLKIKNLSWDEPSAEISYFVSADYQRRGYASESVLAVLCEAFEKLGFNRIYARVIVANKESAELARKLGMVHEGLHRQEFRCGYGELHDVDYFSVMRDGFPAIRAKFGLILGS